MACLWAARRNPTNNLGQPKFKAQSSKFKIAARSLDVSCDVSCDAGASRNFFSRTSRRSEVLDQKFRVRRDYSLSVQRCYRCNAACLDLTSLLIFPSIYIYEPEVGIPSAKLLNFLYVLIRETSKPMSKTRGSISGLCPGQRSADIPPVLGSATDASSAVDATDPSL